MFDPYNISNVMQTLEHKCMESKQIRAGAHAINSRVNLNVMRKKNRVNEIGGFSIGKDNQTGDRNSIYTCFQT